MKKRKIVIYSQYKSTGIGGVENLIRMLQNSTEKDNYETVEVYHHEPINEINTNISHVSYYKVNFKKNAISFLTKRLSSYLKINEICASGNNVIILFHPESLFELSNKTLRNNFIILVQTNKLEKLLCRFGYFSIRLFYRFIDSFVLYTDNDKKELMKRCPFYTSAVQIIPRACRINTVPNFRKGVNNKKIVTIARIQESQKNFIAMIEIMKLLGEEYQLDIYGDGSEQEIHDLKNLIQSASNVNFCGVAYDIQNILGEYSLFIMTSHFEGFGQTLIEARSQALPIVAYDTFEALHWIVSDGNNGYIIDNGNGKLFAEKVKLALNDDITYSRLSMSALKKAKETESKLVVGRWGELIDSFIRKS